MTPINAEAYGYRQTTRRGSIMRKTLATLVVGLMLAFSVTPLAAAAGGDCEGDTPAPTCAPPPAECTPYIEPLQAEVTTIYGWYRDAYTANQELSAKAARQQAQIESQRETIKWLRFDVREDEGFIRHLVRVRERQDKTIRRLRRQLAEAKAS